MKTGGALALVSSGVIKRPKKAYAEEDVGVGAGAADGPLGDLAIVAIEEGLTGVAAVHVEEDVIVLPKGAHQACHSAPRGQSLHRNASVTPVTIEDAC